MSWFGRKKSCRVDFIDADTGKDLARSQLPLASLPRSFEPHTTVQIAGQDWQVVRAEPLRLEGTRKLKLWVRRIRSVAPRDLLYSLPSINDALPGLSDRPVDAEADLLRLHEDDWRQIELVALSQEEKVDRCLQEIRQVHETARVGAAFRRIHVRREPAEPLPGIRLPLPDVLSRFRLDGRVYAGLSYIGAAGMIEGGFAVETGSLLKIYGQRKDDFLAALCLLPSGGSQRDVEALVEIARTHELCLVDWCRAAKVMPVKEEFLRYFTPA